MGGEMLISTVTFPTSVSLDERKERDLFAVKNLDYTQFDLNVLWSELYGCNAPLLSDNCLDLRKCVLTFTDILNTFFACLDSREVTYIDLSGDAVMYITGGLSWGDSPTEAFNFFREYNLIRHYLRLDYFKHQVFSID